MSPPQVIAVMPLNISSAASKFTTGEVFSGIYTLHTQTLPRGELLPAHQTFEQKAAEMFPNHRLISTKEIEAAMSGTPAKTFEDAVRVVPEKVGADSVLTCEMRDVILASAGYESGSEAHAHVTLTLYDAKGEIRWSLSGAIKYVKGGQLAATPTLPEFVGEAMDELKSKVAELR
jgi:hypothetical protein